MEDIQILVKDPRLQEESLNMLEMNLLTVFNHLTLTKAWSLSKSRFREQISIKLKARMKQDSPAFHMSRHLEAILQTLENIQLDQKAYLEIN